MQSLNSEPELSACILSLNSQTEFSSPTHEKRDPSSGGRPSSSQPGTLLPNRVPRDLSALEARARFSLSLYTYISIYNWGAGSRTRSASRRPFRPVQVNGPSAFHGLPLAVAPRSGAGLQHSTVCPDLGFADISGIREN